MLSSTRAQTQASGFTLIELLLVIAIISILAAIVIIAINPARQLAQANNAQRSSNVSTILNAINQYQVDNRGTIPASISSTTTRNICRTGAAATSSCSDLSVLTDNEIYLPSIPIDPTTAGTYDVGYTVIKSATANPRVTVAAPSAELGATISVTR